MSERQLLSLLNLICDLEATTFHAHGAFTTLRIAIKMRQTGACGAPTSERSCHLALAIVNPPQPVRNVKAFSEHPRPLNVGANSPSGLVRRQTRPLTVAAAADTAAPTASGPVADDFTHVSTDGRWRVRLINRSDYNEVKQVVRLQTDGFHVPNGVPLLDGAFKKMFRAEVSEV